MRTKRSRRFILDLISKFRQSCNLGKQLRQDYMIAEFYSTLVNHCAPSVVSPTMVARFRFLRFYLLIANLNQLQAGGGAGFDRDLRFGALEVFGDERDQLFIGLAINRR